MIQAIRAIIVSDTRGITRVFSYSIAVSYFCFMFRTFQTIFNSVGASRTAFTSSETSAPQMVPEQFAVEVTNFATQNSALIATSENDFGGLLFPVFGLLGLGALILFLAPPLADED